VKRLRSSLIVGAGICGLVAARRLSEQGVRVTILEKGRSVGGRMATRRIGPGACDHGAQFLTATNAVFAAMVEHWLDLHLLSPWAEMFPDSAGKYSVVPLPRYRGHPAMTAVPKSIAQGLDVKLGQRVLRASVTPYGWEVITDEGVAFTADALLLTAPVPQSLALFESEKLPFDREIAHALRSVRYHPCIAAMFVLDGDSSVPAPGAIHVLAGPVRWIADNKQKGISPATTLTVHTTAEFSSGNFETTDELTLETIQAAAQPWLQGKILERQIHRWRYSEPITPGTTGALIARTTPPLAFAGDAFGEPNVEGAALSGLHAADRLIELLT
jgi:renalase